MSERRMFSKSITESDAFLDLPLSAQALYFHLSMNADDEGFVNSSKRIRNMCGASREDLQILSDKSFVITFKSGVQVIKHWKINNKLRKDRSRQTNYPEEKALLVEKTNGVYSLIQKQNEPAKTEPVAKVADETPVAEIAEEITERQEAEKTVEAETVEAETITEPAADSEPLEYTAETDAHKGYAEIVYDLFSTHKLPCANSIVSFEMRDFRLALGAIQRLHLSSDEVIQAVKNYIEVVELKRKGLTWWNSEQSFNAFCEKNTIMKFLPDYFKIEDFYKDKGADNAALEGKIQL